jgi:hypothetical protein
MFDSNLVINGGGPQAVLSRPADFYNRLMPAGSRRLLLHFKGDPGCLRPWYYDHPKKGRKDYITLQNGVDGQGKPKTKDVLVNTPALLTRDAWLKIDQKIQWAAKKRLKFFGDMRARVPRPIPNSMGTIAIGRKMASGDADVVVSMDPVRLGERSKTVFDEVFTPNPVIHGNGSFTLREMLVSEQGGIPLDTTQIGLIGRKIGEVLEQWALGLIGSFSYLGGFLPLYGATNFPQRSTQAMTLPTAGGWTPKTMINELLTAIKTMKDNFYFGPYTLYYSNGWSSYLNNDYSQYYGSTTLLKRTQDIVDIEAIKNLDYLPDYQMLLVQFDDDVLQAAVGMEVQTLQWSEMGGMEEKFMVMAMQHPLFKYDPSSKTGVMHLTGA